MNPSFNVGVTRFSFWIAWNVDRGVARGDWDSCGKVDFGSRI
jgi:hypothetical protein